MGVAGSRGVVAGLAKGIAGSRSGFRGVMKGLSRGCEGLARGVAGSRGVARVRSWRRMWGCGVRVTGDMQLV